MTTYPFKQGIDYGPRQGSLGLGFHMSEGGDGLVAYLAKHASETNVEWRNRVRGVSINAAILSDGTIWQMVAWDHATGSFNPADRNPATTGYYNGTIIKDVLGSHYVDPNTWTVTTEIAGYRATGPTDKQVVAAVKWGLEMRAMFPSIRGAFGHHDQTDTKGCPGTTVNMKAIFEGVGGHGLFHTSGDDMPVFKTFAKPKLVTVPTGGYIYVKPDLSANTGNIQISPGRDLPVAGTLSDGTLIVGYRDTTPTEGIVPTYYVKGTIKDYPPPVAPPPVQVPPDAVSCKPFSDAAVKTAVAEDRAKAYVAWKA